MSELPDDLRRLIGERTDDVAKVIDGLVAQLRLTPAEEDFAREQAGRVFDPPSDALVQAYPRAGRMRYDTATAAVIAFKSVQTEPSRTRKRRGGSGPSIPSPHPCAPLSHSLA